MASLQELLDQQAAVAHQIAALQRESRVAVISEIRVLMVQHGLTSADIATAPRPKGAQGPRAKVAPKYLNPETQQTWSGRGLKPKWLAENLKAGSALTDFAI